MRSIIIRLIGIVTLSLFAIGPVALSTTSHHRDPVTASIGITDITTVVALDGGFEWG
jgi:hypothetical protein